MNALALYYDMCVVSPCWADASNRNRFDVACFDSVGESTRSAM